MVGTSQSVPNLPLSLGTLPSPTSNCYQRRIRIRRNTAARTRAVTADSACTLHAVLLLDALDGPPQYPQQRRTRSHRSRRDARTCSIFDKTTDERVIGTRDFSFFSTGVQAGLCSWCAASTILNGSWRRE